MTTAYLKPALFGLLALNALLLSVAFMVAERPFAIPAVLLICVVWGVLLWQDGRWAPSWPVLLLALIAVLSLAPIGPVTPERPLLFSYLGVIGTLLLWDLSRFWQRLQDVADDNAAQPLIIAHLRRLGLLLAAALVALAAQQWLPLTYNFDRALISGLLLIFGLNALLNRLRAEPS